MDSFISAYEQKLKQLISDVNYYDKNLKSLSDWWGKIALIGKINSLDVAATILEDMDTARSSFHELQDRLIQKLVYQHARKAILHHQSRCQMAIDVLIRNLFERTADIGFLSSDAAVVSYILQAERSATDVVAMRQRMQDYVDKYTVYNDALILSKQGEVLFQLSNDRPQPAIAEDCVKQALAAPDDFVEYFGPSAMRQDGKSHLFYLHSVRNGCEVIGVVVLCFRFRNEITTIFEQLSDDDEVPYVIVNEKGEVLNQLRKHGDFLPKYIPNPDRPSVLTHNDTEMLLVSTPGNPYQGYAGPKGWRACALMPMKGFAKKLERDTKLLESLPPLKELPRLFSNDLLDIRTRSTLINNDLELIVLNGIITAARSDSAEFMPVLEAIKGIGRDIDSMFAKSIESLFSTILFSQLDEVKLQAELAVDIVDRNLYERANDCRWWAQNPSIREALAERPVDKAKITQTLRFIHRLYTVYHDLYVYDKERHYVALSTEEGQKFLGAKVGEQQATGQALELKDIQEYRVSAFAPSDLYHHQSTYIYNGAIRDPDAPQKVIGGIGIVFDAFVEFQAILRDVLPKHHDHEAFAVFTDEQGRVISCSDDRYAVHDVFMPDIPLDKLKSQGSLAVPYQLGTQHYLMGVALSQGYREFKKQDGYRAPILAWVLLPC